MHYMHIGCISALFSLVFSTFKPVLYADAIHVCFSAPPSARASMRAPFGRHSRTYLPLPLRLDVHAYCSERCRILKREVGEEVRIALETEGEAGIAKLERSLWDKKLRENPAYAHHAIPQSQSMPNLAAMARGGTATPTPSSSSSNTPAAKKKQRATSVSPVLGASGRKTKGKKLASSMKRSSSHRSITSLSKNKMMDIAGDKLAILSLVCADMDAQLDNYATTA
eukprot:TRINITY_DN109_c0_g1_i2.p1 TRINITY_DN109_c0_g1~~TRINITY_DN109_c0_g1_i2.p1  ORF type:complete len:225 (+),score=51.89 TRINITY_DN109_c0_g1_i2:1079-1753(+)